MNRSSRCHDAPTVVPVRVPTSGLVAVRCDRGVNGQAIQACPSCGLRSAVSGGPTQPYMLGSAGCWATFGELLARNGADPAHQLAADAYAGSHPGVPEWRAIQSVAVHLMILHLVLDRDADPARRSDLLRRMTRRPAFHWLEPRRSAVA